MSLLILLSAVFLCVLILLSAVFLCGKSKYYYSKDIYACQKNLVSVIGVMLAVAIDSYRIHIFIKVRIYLVW